MVAGILALSSLTGCYENSERIKSKETILIVEDSMKAYVDINNDQKVDFYCEGEAVSPIAGSGSPHLHGGECFIAKGFKDSLTKPTILDTGFNSLGGGSLIERIPLMSTELELRINREYKILTEL
jgi:hypothetical protein